MFKRGIYLLLVFALFFLPISEAYSQSIYSIGINPLGYLDIGSGSYGDNMRLLVEKDSEKYYYSIDNSSESIPLQLGNGNYTVKILENIQGKRYKVVSKEDILLKNFNDNVFLTSTQPVYWHKSKELSNLSENLTKELHNDLDKVERIYNYIVENIQYDDYKISGLKDNYVPNIEATLISKKGICYDYAATFAGMLRSLGIPTKLVKGYKDNLKTYHAWNEVLINGQWHIIDTTYDATLQNTSKNVIMIKEASEYEKIREY